MIFVTIGSSGQFESLIRHMDKLSPQLKEEVVLQIGNSNYQPLNCKYFDFANDLSPYFAKADLVIAHGGAGTCFEVLGLGKKLIAIENKEVSDSHQWDLLQKLDGEGYILWCREITELETCIEKARRHEFKPYVAPICDIPKKINEFLDESEI